MLISFTPRQLFTSILAILFGFIVGFTFLTLAYSFITASTTQAGSKPKFNPNPSVNQEAPQQSIYPMF